MLPLRDNIPHFRPPFVTYCLIILNCLFFLWEMSLGPHFFGAIENLGFVPARFLEEILYTDVPLFQAILPMFTSIFLHAGWLHLLANMWFLLIFGDNVEDVLGHSRYFFFYLVCGVGANFIYLFFSPNTATPLVGASGAIAGVMGGYFSLFPTARILTLFLIVFFPIFLELPAYYFLSLWFLLQFLFGIFTQVAPSTGKTGVAWWAHVGGFVIGLLLIRFLVPDHVWLPLRRR
jgi:membrane associated rhomboid family serine protease